MNERDRETLESVLHDLVRLLADDERFAILDGARLRKAALGLARFRGVKPSGTAVHDLTRSFRRARALRQADDLDAWCFDRGITPQEFVALMSDEATLGAVRMASDLPDARDVADFLRVVEGVDALWTRARTLRDNPHHAEPPAARELLHAWYETKLGTSVPDDIESDAWRRGFEDTDDLVRALARTSAAVTPARLEGLSVGDPVPDFVLEHPEVGDVRPDLLAGRWWALVLAAPGAPPSAVRALEGALGDLDGLVVTRDANTEPSRWPVVGDPDERVRARAGLGDGTFVLLVDPASRIAAVEALDDLARVADIVRARAKPHETLGATAFAPVLIVPGAFEESFCRTLIERWEGDHEEGAVTANSDDGARAVHDEGIKRRSDHVVRDGALEAAIKARLARRVFPEVRRAFQFEVGACEGFRVGCYDDAGGGGFFRPHRDDVNPQTASRRFALSVNLAQGTYTGGGLRLPEYGVSLDAPTGAAVVYSASVLHEVEAVTRGRRFVLVGFFSGQSR